MQKIRIIGVGVALLFAFGILAVSLTSVTAVRSAEDENHGSSAHKEFYISGEILPDHIAYPVLMAIDRLKLEAASPLERVYLQTEYANRRLAYTQSLIKKDKVHLALSTYTKAQKYLLGAGWETLEEDLPASVKRYVKKTVEFHHETSVQLSDHFNDQDKNVIIGLNKESMILLEQLEAAS